MDPLTALSVVGTIVQFVDFGSRLLSECRELYKSPTGSLSANQELELITKDLRAVVKKLSESTLPGRSDMFNSAPENDVEQQQLFETICDASARVAEELVTRLEGLKVEGRRKNRWKSLAQALKAAWSRDEVMDLRARLSALRKALETRLLVSIRENINVQSISAAAQFDKIDQQTQLIMTLLMTGRKELSKVITTAVAQLVSRIESIHEHEHRRTREDILNARRDNRQVGDVAEITAGIEMLDVSWREESKLRLSVQTKILKELQSSVVTSRYENIIESHPQTFEWAFCESTTCQPPWSNLAKWLREEDGFYWINGKAGSGKSTLMKQIFDDARTFQCLQQWAQKAQPYPAPLCIATFFFWNGGTREQKSQHGLLQTLLFQILSQYPDLIPLLFPKSWAKIYSELLSSKPGDIPQFWSLSVYITAFKTLFQQTSIPLKVCLLIDGLDECDGDPEDLVELLIDITKTSCNNVKICLSSRPWVVFQDTFRIYPGLRLQDLTQIDVKLYVTEKFHRNSAFQGLMAREPQMASMLINEIIERADGVFLWVKLVVKSLLNGIRNRDSIPDLLKRLRHVPGDLEPLYEHLLGLIEPQYLEWASNAFQIVQASREVEDHPFGKFIRGDGAEVVQPLDLLSFYLAMNKEIKPTDIVGMTKSSIIARCQDIQAQMTARCCGLIEVRSSFGRTIEGSECYSAVQYFHTTVCDFFKRGVEWPGLQHRVVKSSFEPHFALMKSQILLLGLGFWSSFKSRADLILGLDRVAFSAITYAYHADMESKSDDTRRLQLELLDYLGNLMNHYCCYKIDDRHRLWEYLPMKRATSHVSHGESHWCNEIARLIDDRHGSWEDIPGEILNISPEAARLDTKTQVAYLRLTKILLSAGANPHIRPHCISLEDLLAEHVMPRFPKETTEVLSELRRMLSITQWQGDNLLSRERNLQEAESTNSLDTAI